MDNNNLFNNPLFQNTPSIETLWRDEKSKYRHWIIYFFIVLVAIISLFIVAISLTLANRENIIDDLYRSVTADGQNPTFTTSDARTIVLRDNIIIPGIQAVLFLVALVLWTKTTIESYKIKNFSKLSVFAIIFIELCGFFALINVISLLFRTGQAFNTSYQIFSFINQFVMVGSIFFAVMVSGIKRKFQISERIEALRNNPQFGEMMGGFNNPFFSNINNPNNYTNKANNPPNSNNQNSQGGPSFGAGPTPPNAQQPLTKQQQIENDLNSLSFQQLKDMAKKLSISGYDSMSQEELLIVIKRLLKEN